MRIVIAGAGSIGCFCGGLLALGGHDVTLLGRAPLLARIGAHGLRLSDYGGLDLHLGADRLTLATDPACLAQAELVIVTVKTPATAEMASAIATHAPASAPVLSWQNGLENTRQLRARLPGRDIRAGMVPFNVVPLGEATWHRASSGDIVIAAGPGGLGAALTVPGLPVAESLRIEAVQWGKLVINLNNALNALSGLTLVQQLADRSWRRLMAAQMAEALAVLRAAEIPVAATTPLPAWTTPHILRLPNTLFTRIAARMLTVDPSARSSMAYDLEAGRMTEIASLQGEIIRLGRAHDVATPICSRVAALIDAATHDGAGPPRLTVAQIAPPG
ncbi:2-dehydropantoate 2-reductase [Ruegeria pomeroyi]|uniref:2-dehydropantoate 2-reductase n=2 Tax=Ruegeria pomeroyi TaxID=89184 RepID=Q5LUT6_RUEPO|nr:2-dehydropantoate 2-reductase [Ruegeria pomeroyi]AAV94271.1 2-dehydropantoate 2-reductase [Ruegeria pomeroyi DSS-3]NVK97583.1 2-dehydropantoate 2-reductase [Ruegeria pomeroyi]NVL01404.1 2-dehydropantoate 2-reductase [Ruegeria pomeroyi]QWV07843.1 2-dehydropantoate 2-reductase [Ruegeria pomeroyi]